MTGVGDLLRACAGDDATGLLFEDQRWTWDQVVTESAARAALIEQLLDSTRPPHVGVLLENVPEYLFWAGGAALTGAAIVGINPTRRGEELARDIRHTDCQLIVTDASQIEFARRPRPRCRGRACARSRHAVVQRRCRPSPARPFPTDDVDADAILLPAVHIGLDRCAEGGHVLDRSHGGRRRSGGASTA